MGQQIRGTFQRGLIVVWVAVMMLFIGLVQQLDADVNTGHSNEGGWVQTNGPYGGDILALYAAPKGVLFAGTGGAGIFRSTDRGDTWTPVNTGLRFEPGESFWSVTAFAQKGDTLYAGTRDGLYASTDGGNTWHHVSTFQSYESISGLVVIADRIYVGTLNRGVWYSDDGDSWIPVSDGLVDELFKANPRAVPNAIGLGPMLIRKLVGIGTTVVAATDRGIFRRRANEDSWTPIDTDAVSQPVNIALVNKARIDMGLDPLPKRNFPSGIRVESFAAMEHLLYMSVYMGNDPGLFRSNDEGESWTYITSAEMTRTAEALAVYGGTLYASSGGRVYRSDDKGDSWTAVNDGLTHGTVSTLLAVNEDTVFVGTSGNGVFRTTDDGNSWVEINTGITNATISELEVVGDRLYTGVGGKIVYSADGGESWQPVKIPSMPIQYGFPSLSVSDGELYVGAVRYATHNQGEDLGGIFRLDAENNTLVELIVDRNLAGLECMEVVGTTFYIGTLDNGVIQWEKGSGPWTTNLGLEHHYVWILSGNGENVYAGTGDDEIYRLKAGRWEPIHSTDMIGSNMSDLKSVGSILYATFWSGGVSRSINGGDSWTSINDGLDEASAVSIGTDGTKLYVGTFTGVFQWVEDKEQWKPIGSLPHQVLSLAVLDSFLYAGTAYSGVFKIRIAE